MATGRSHGFLRQLDGLLAEGTAAGLTDGQLLERFSARGGPAAELAFAAIVERHGPMVLRVCRGVLGRSREADAEDAFQATFLVLVKRARSLWVADSLGPWLHQVALRTASCARGAAARRHRHEAAGARPAEATVNLADDEGRDELGRILHEEIGRLPDRYRIPVVLCDLEGQTHEQAARHAGWPVGTVKSRLTRARERLRGRLARRGVSPTIALLPMFRLELDAQVPDALIRSTTAAALRLAASHTLAGTTAGLLAQGVLTTMARSSWWKAGTAILAAAATVSGARLGAGQTRPSAPPPSSSQPGAGAEVATVKAEQGPFRVVVSGNGTLETDRYEKVTMPVESNTAIVRAVPDGSRVKKGDLVIELDSSASREGLSRQRFATRSAEARVRIARLARETAEAAVREYEDTYRLRDRSTAAGEVKLAEAEAAKAEARLERTRQAREKLRELQGRREQASTPGQLAADLDMEDRVERAEQDALRGKIHVELAQNQLNLLENYTKGKTLKALTMKVEEARASEGLRLREYEQEKANEAHCEAQVQACRVLSPQDGFITHLWNQARSTAGERKVVTPHQLLFIVGDPAGPMDIAARLGEPTIDRVTEGQKVDVRVDAYPEKRFTGVVTRVPNGPDETRTASGKHVYTTMVRLDGIDPSLRLGMNGHVDILVAERPDAITVPFEAVLGRMPPFRLAVKQPDGRVEIREVALGYSDESRVEVKSGLRPGEQVVLKPRSLLGEMEASQGGR